LTLQLIIIFAPQVEPIIIVWEKQIW